MPCRGASSGNPTAVDGTPRRALLPIPHGITFGPPPYGRHGDRISRPPTLRDRRALGKTRSLLVEESEHPHAIAPTCYLLEAAPTIEASGASLKRPVESAIFATPDRCASLIRASIMTPPIPRPWRPRTTPMRVPETRVIERTEVVDEFNGRSGRSVRRYGRVLYDDVRVAGGPGVRR